MNQKERLLAQDSFSKYYKTAELNIPNLEKREFGVGFTKKIEARHMSFESKEQLKNYLINNTPFFISHSTAHYESPATTPIGKKGWLGADLVFDLDAHAEGKYGVYSKLDEVKEDCIRLAEEFLEDDFGLSKNEMIYVFSGNRGYHVHVRSKDVFTLGTQERREITDYIRGAGLDFKEFFYKNEQGRTVGPKTEDQGYRGRFVKKVLQVLDEKPSKIYRGFSNKERKLHFIEGLKDGNWSRIPFNLEKLQTKLLFIAQDLPLFTVDADAAVTYDIKKLIRMPNSIHGDTGLIAKEVKDMNSFNPLNHAFPKYNNSVEVEFLEDVPKLELLDSTYEFSKSQKTELPLSIALFFMLKQSAIVVPGGP